jgi:hypothetical protein
MDRDPRAPIVRKVFIYPANGDEPHITDMTFNEAGAKHRYGLYTTAVDLRSFYGRHMHATRLERLGVENQPDKRDEGEYIVYYNLSPKLPLNLAIAHIVGVDPRRPGPRLMFRGNVVIVKTQEWPGPLIIGGGAHMDYLDVRTSMRGTLDIFIKKWYNSEQWANKLNDEQSFRE